MNLGSKINGKKILITGAGGFIGGRIVERLRKEDNCQIRALVHDINKATRVARFDIEIVVGDVLDKKLINNIVKDVDYIVHCAAGDRKTIVEGTRNVLQAGLINNVDQMVHFSTMAVYGYPLPKKCNEETPHKKVSGDSYNNSKIEAEKIVNKYLKKGLSCIVLQPTIVYGPYSKSWTIGPINEIKGNSLVLVDKGMGLSNPVYVDNLVDAVFLSLGNKKAVGETFIISGGERIIWRDFFGAYERMLSKRVVEEEKRLGIKLLALPLKPARKAKKYLYNKGIYKGSPSFVKKYLLPIVQRDQAVRNLSKNRELFLKQKCVFEIKKAKKILGYSPKVTFTKGMKLTEKWLRYSRYI